MIRVPSSLSCLPRKRELYATDPYFRDAWEDILALWGAERAQSLLFDLAPVIYRPDALVARGVGRGLRATRELGFAPVACGVFRYNRLSVREGWRYQLNIATRDRIDVMDMIMPATESLYVAMKRAPSEVEVPATTCLSSFKGPSLPENRKPHHLRSLLGKAQVSVLTYVHISDEPADIVRELGIFFDRPQRLEILRAIEAGEDVVDGVERAADELYARIPAHTLDFVEALDRVEGMARPLLGRNGDGGGRAYEEMVSMCVRMRVGECRDWRRLLTLIDEAGLPVGHWDRVAFAAPLAEKHLDEADLTLPDISAADWRKYS